REPMYHGSHSIGKYANALSSQLSTYGDSTYVGYTPGFVGKDFTGAPSANNPWSITASTTTAATTNVHRPPKAGCMWNWDPEEAGGNGYPNGDSLQGWWPLRLQYRYTSAPNLLGAADYTDP